MVAVVADKVVTVLQADVDTYIGNINKAEANFAQKLALMQTEAQQLGTVMDIAGRNSGKAFQAVNQNAPKAAAAIKGVNSELKYLPAQLNDIAVQLAGGQSPFLIAVQQGSQINQALGGLGARGAVAALGGAFTSLINPVNLAVFALIAAGGVAAQFFSSMVDGGEKTAEQLKKEAQLIHAVADKWGDLLPAVKAYADEIARAVSETDKLAAIDIAKQNIGEKVQSNFAGLNQEIKDVITLVPEAQRQFVILGGKIDAGSAKADDFTGVINTLKDVAAKQQTDYFDEAIKKLIAMQVEAGKATAKITELTGEASKFSLTGTPGPFSNSAGVRLPGTAPIPGQLGVDDVSGDGNFRTASSFLKSRAQSQRIADRIDLLDTDFADKLAQLLVKFPNLKVASAVRTFNEQKAIYDSGVRPAAKPGNSLHEKGLAVDLSAGGGVPSNINAIYEAARALGIVFPVKGDPLHAQPLGSSLAGGGGVDPTSHKKTPGEIFKGKTDDVQKRIDSLNAQVAAQNKLNPLVKDYGYAVEQAKIKAELLNEAQQAGLTITPELSKSIDEYATNLAKATAARSQLTEAQKYAAEAVREGSEFGKDALGGFIRDLRDGKTAAEAFANVLDKIADKLLDTALNAAFDLGPGGTGGGGPLSFLGSIFGSLFRASGGPVRKGQPYVVGEKRAELFIPDSNGSIMPSVPNIAMPARSGNSGGALTVQSTVGVVNGEIVPLMTRVSGVVAGQQVKQASKASPSRLNSYQTRGT